MRADGSDQRQLTATSDVDAEPTWSPDGRRLVFRRSSAAAGSDLVIMDLESGDLTPLAMTGEQRQPAWSPDGRRIAFVGHPTITATPEVFSALPGGTDIRRHTDAEWGGALNSGWLRRD